MKKLKIGYWIFTGLLVLLMGFSAIPNIMVNEDSVVFFQQLGYPTYIIPFLGVAKLLGVIALLIPGFPRIKEWVYAGFVYDLAGAFYSILGAGNPFVSALPLVIGFGIIAGSYWFHHRLMKQRETDKAALVA